MSTKPLSDARIKALRPPDRAKKYFDGGGLYLEVTPAGGKYWRLKYRFGGKEKRISFGVYPEVPLKEARERRDDARRLLRDGIDPSAERKAKKAQQRAQNQDTLAQVAADWYAVVAPGWSEAYAMRVWSRLKSHLLSKLGELHVDAVTDTDLLSAINELQEDGRVETAHRVLKDSSEIFRFAMAAKRGRHDPTLSLRRQVKKRPKATHFAAFTEPNDVANLMRKIYAYEGTPTVCAAVKLAALTLVRPGELRRAEWQDIDLEAGEWRFLVTKTDTQHIVPLSRQAMDILRDLHLHTGHRKWVFPGAHSPKRPMSENAVLDAIRRMGFSNEQMTGHGFRAMARTLLDEQLGFRVDYIEHQLAHAVRDPNGRAYNRTKFLKERAQMMQAYADYLDQLREGSNVSGIGAARQQSTGS